MSTQGHQQTQAKQEGQLRLDAISKSVLQALGQPENLLRVQIRALWGDHFRANVLVGDDILTSRIVHSYFLAVDPDGNLTTSVPPIKRQY